MHKTAFTETIPILAGVKRILCLGAHSDDIEIGCGGTILRLLRSDPSLEIHWHVFSGPGERRREALASARHFLGGRTHTKVRVWAFRESYFPDQWARIKNAFEVIAKQSNPNLVFTHWGGDGHQDHRVLSELSWNTFRNHLVLEYEIPKYDGDLGRPNLYVTLTPDLCQAKVDALGRYFRTQAGKPWFSDDTFLGLMRLRGIECGARARFAEAFFARKIVL
jgi:LmbE family N-acetylglucosaminyl deacetylase